ncbi:hypothetical protein [Dyadobacter sp. 3J3]|uniref:hypothetical protein n=1 Tax=Dyadobacter sp. 3J3 TaxID=2606600 RepID=UPI00135C30A0|nr:hypothetical protein [Dyadobacter sp. 3J3]
MKKLFISLTICAVLSNSCKSEKEIFPEGEWHRNCISFRENLDGYQLGGLPCQFMDVPNLRIQKDKPFETMAIYHSFDGSGFSNDTIALNGNLSKDGQTLRLNYMLGSNSVDLTLVAGHSTELCTSIGCN